MRIFNKIIFTPVEISDFVKILKNDFIPSPNVNAFVPAKMERKIKIKNTIIPKKRENFNFFASFLFIFSILIIKS